MCMYGYGCLKKRVYMDRYAAIQTYGTKELRRRVWIEAMDQGMIRGMDRLWLRGMDRDLTFWAAAILLNT